MLPSRCRQHKASQRRRNGQQTRTSGLLHQQLFCRVKQLFPEKGSKKCTHRTTKPYEFKAPWSKERFAELDLFLTKTELRNLVHDVEAKSNYAFNSDHVPVVAEIRSKIRAQKRDEKIPIKRYRKPTEEQSYRYNQRVMEKYEKRMQEYPAQSATTILAWAVTEAAE